MANEKKPEKADEPKKDDGLIAVTKGGEVLRVHPDCVKAHKAAGWLKV